MLYLRRKVRAAGSAWPAATAGAVGGSQSKPSSSAAAASIASTRRIPLSADRGEPSATGAAIRLAHTLNQLPIYPPPETVER